MKTLTSWIFRKKEPKLLDLWRPQKRYFRRDGVLYLAKDDGTLWAHVLERGEMFYEKKDYFLGTYRNGKIEPVENFYDLPWTILKMSEQMFQKVQKGWTRTR